VARTAALAALLSLLGVHAGAIKSTDQFSLDDLEKTRSMKPGEFAELFERFFYEFSPRVLPPADFVRQRAGDCDDYAILAGHILGQKGYKTRLIQVQLTGNNVDHAITYVTGDNVYLDYNNRALRQKLVKANPTVRDVAKLVADSFQQSWTAGFEYTYSYAERRKRIQWVIVKTDPPERDADRRPAS
jgi:hypothetical protein